MAFYVYIMSYQIPPTTPPLLTPTDLLVFVSLSVR